MSTLFLQGPRFSGKSTLLVEELQGLDLGGFFVQRHQDTQGIIGFELKAVADIGKKSQTRKNWFIVTKPTHHYQKAVFESYGLQLLQESQQKKIILLDEIGGIELLVPSFRQALLKILQGNQLVLGVFKSDENARTQKQLFNHHEILGFRQEIKQAIQENGQLLDVETKNLEEIREKINSFLGVIY